MSAFRFLAFAAVAAMPLSLAAGAAPAAAVSAEAASALDAALAGPWRSEANRARDQYRHPKETLAFFGLEPGMTVIEASPGSGWYTEVLAPVLKDKGHLIAAVNNPAASDNAKQAWDRYAAWTAERRQQFGNVTLAEFGKGVTKPLAAPGTVDLVVTFRNSHDWRNGGFDEEAYRAFYAALKPGGVLGIVDHRLPENREETEATRRSSYVKESSVIAAAEKAGFRLDSKSEVNANPKDSADWPGGVFTLPPTLRLGDEDRAKYMAIGESDRMTLRFVKPAS